MSLRVGIIGVGGIGHTHLRAYAGAGNAAVAVTDMDQERAKTVAAETGAEAYPDVASMLRDARLDAVSVCTPPAGHLPAALAALQAGVAVLCEKPMALTSAECEQLSRAADRAGVVLAVGHCHRFQPHVEAMRSAIGEGAIGTVLTFRNRFSGLLAGVESTWFSDPAIAGGGVLMDTCVHSIDLFRYLIGDVAAVRAVTATTASHLGPALAVEDTAILTLRSVDGVVGDIEASWRARPGEATITVFGTDGMLQMDYGTMTLTRTGPDGGAPEAIAVPDGDRFTRQAAHFLDCVRTAAQPRVTAADGLAALQVLEAAYASAS